MINIEVIKQRLTKISQSGLLTKIIVVLLLAVMVYCVFVIGEYFWNSNQAKKDGRVNSTAYTSIPHTEDEVVAIKKFTDNRGNIIVMAPADYQGNRKDTINYSTYQRNQVHKAIDAETRINDDEVVVGGSITMRDYATRLAKGTSETYGFNSDNVGSGRTKILLDSYVGDGGGDSSKLEKWDSEIQVGDKVSALRLASMEPNGSGLRVRNITEIVKVQEDPDLTDSDPTEPTDPLYSDPEPTDQVDLDPTEPTDQVLDIREVDSNDEETLQLIENAIGDDYEKYKVFDINLLQDDVEVQLDEAITIVLDIPEDFDDSRVVVFRIEEDGTKTEVDGKVEDGKYEFETDGLNLYVIAEKKEVPKEETEPVLDIREVDANDKATIQLIETALGDDYEKYKAFDTNLLQDGVEVQPDGMITIVLDIPEDFDDSRVVVFRIEEDGTKTKVDGKVEDGKYEFETEHLGLYVMTEEKEAPKEETEDDVNTDAEGDIDKGRDTEDDGSTYTDKDIGNDRDKGIYPDNDGNTDIENKVISRIDTDNGNTNGGNNAKVEEKTETEKGDSSNTLFYALIVITLVVSVFRMNRSENI